ncbi:Glutathione S-transferase DHAR1_ mitochondrial [Caligus rogercresseyi]|uniref:Glutathione S-transferase DHAR1_ mitochondrial n=1 Tax=Caligus rogercresseyi TaxID=217165 RepID=A0A7T8GXI2_CALRO|nr:Glutathione S-transferase DHAR1_ mitochondrial [Caligus rogercresseyi]
MTAILPEFHPQVYEKFQGGFPHLHKYMDAMFAHKNFQGTTYDKALVVEAWKVKRASS